MSTSVEGRPLDTENELIRRARRGDPDAFAELVTRHQEAAVRLAYVMAGPADADDVAQDAFVSAWNALDRFRDGSPFRPWLLRIVANRARNAHRAAGRRAQLALRSSAARPSVDAAPSTEEAVLADAARARLLAAVDALPERDRDVVSCRYLAGLSEAETATALGCRPGTVKSRLSRALPRLRAVLGDDADG